MKFKKIILTVAIIKMGTILLFSFLTLPETRGQTQEENAIIPFGINNPFSPSDSDGKVGVDCIATNSALKFAPTYIERHIEADTLKNCIPLGVGYMENIKKVGVNLISQHFNRRYCEEDCPATQQKELPYFGLEEFKHRNHEIPTQLYINGGYGNYFWAAINPESTKSFHGDIYINDGGEIRYLPDSEDGFREWQNWLVAMFNYLEDHNAINKLAYIQLGNESDGDYAKSKEDICRENNNDIPCSSRQIKNTEREPWNPKHYRWSAYAKVIEKSYDIIKQRAPYTKIAIGAIAGSAVSRDGFQRPVSEYLAGKINEDGKIVNREKRCGGTGCFDVFDYHDYSGYENYKGKIACGSKDCQDYGIYKISKSPEEFKRLLAETGFSDKGLVIQQGGTYTGQDKLTRFMEEYQTEEDQAAYLVKRAVYLTANGVDALMFNPYSEHYGYKGTIHNWFTMMGFVFNGTPKPGEAPYYLLKPPDEVKQKFGNNCNQYPDKFKPWCEYNNNKGACDGQLPCPDPGEGVKKLTWFSQKKLIENLGIPDWDRIESLIPPPENSQQIQTVFAYKLSKKDAQEPVYVAWWDWWKDYPRKEAEVERCKEAHKGDNISMDKCVNELDKPLMSKNITLNFANTGKIKITEALPKYTVGAQVNDYSADFNSYEVSDKDDGLSDNNFIITLGKKPIYIEEIPDHSPTACMIKPEQTIQTGDTVYLDGSCSFDIDGDYLVYQWSQTFGAPVVLQNSNTTISSFIAPNIIVVKSKNSSLATTLLSSISVVVEFFKSIFAAETGTNNNEFGFQLIVSANNKSSAVPAKVTVVPSSATTFINIISPPDGTVLSPDSKTEIKVKAKGENIKSVYFFVNDGVNVQKYKGRYNKQEDIYFFNWSILGGYSKSYDIEAQLATQLFKKSEIITKSKPIIIYSANAPTISIIKLQNNQIVQPRQKITIEAKFNPNNIGITKVEFSIVGNSKTIKQVDLNPNQEGTYSFIWTVPNTPGIFYQIQADGYAQGNNQTPVSVSPTIEVKVE